MSKKLRTARTCSVRTYDSRVKTVAGAAKLDRLLLDDLLGRHVLVLFVFVAGVARLLDCGYSRRPAVPLVPIEG